MCFRKKVTICWYESPINPIKPWAGCYILTSLRDRRPRRSTPSQERPPRPCIQYQRMCHAVRPLRVHTSHAHHACASATHALVKPRESALKPFYNVSPPRDRTRLHLAAFLGYSQSPQTNTSLFCTLCPHSCAPKKYFSVGHPSLNCSRPSTL